MSVACCYPLSRVPAVIIYQMPLIMHVVYNQWLLKLDFCIYLFLLFLFLFITNLTHLEKVPKFEEFSVLVWAMGYHNKYAK